MYDNLGVNFSVEIEVEHMNVTERTIILDYINSLDVNKVTENSIGIEIDDFGNVLRIIVYTDNEETAKTLSMSLNELSAMCSFDDSSQPSFNIGTMSNSS